jgi:hypothetical protein
MSLEANNQLEDLLSKQPATAAMLLLLVEKS